MKSSKKYTKKATARHKTVKNKEKDKNLKKKQNRENRDFTFRIKTLRLTANFSTGKRAAKH